MAAQRGKHKDRGDGASCFGMPLQPESASDSGTRANLESNADRVRLAYIEGKLPEIRERAERGDTDAQVVLGAMYGAGLGVPADATEAARWAHRAANHGNPDAQQILAWLHLYGFGAHRDVDEGIRRSLLAAEGGSPDAMHTIGLAYLEGIHLPLDCANGMYWLEKAANMGHAKAAFSLGVRLLKGVGAPPDTPRAIRLLRQAAEGGEPKAQFVLGLAYELGTGVEIDLEQSVQWIMMSARAGYAQAQFRLAAAYREGKGVDRDADEAARWLQMAAAQGYLDAARLLGRGLGGGQCPGTRSGAAHPVWSGRPAAQDASLIAGSSPASALRVRRIDSTGGASNPQRAEQLLEGARNGSPDAQTALGAMYRDGVLGSVNSGEAVRWFRKAASQHHPLGTFYLAQAYLGGQGVRQNEVEAIRLLVLSAQSGCVPAQDQLGLCCHLGQGLRQDYVQSVRWHALAVECDPQNSWPRAAKHLAARYEMGEGVVQDMDEARRLYQLAADGGLAEAQQWLRSHPKKA